MKRKSGVFAVLYILSCVLPVIPLAILSTIQDITRNENIISDASFFFSIYAFMFIIAVALFHEEIKDSLVDFFKKPIKRTFFIFILLIVTYFINYKVSIFFSINEETNNQESLLKIMQDVPFFVNFIYLTFIAPLVEEIFFRHILIGEFSNFVGGFIASIISIIAFVCAHSIAFPECMAYLPLALSITGVYIINKGSISSSFMFHAMNNAFVSIIIYLS